MNSSSPRLASSAGRVTTPSLQKSDSRSNNGPNFGLVEELRMQDDTYWAAVTRLRLRLADLLETLSPEDWEHPSLCTGWRVRDVAGHLALVPTITVREMAAAAPHARFDPDRINTHLARR